jgi:hypothetical protein
MIASEIVPKNAKNAPNAFRSIELNPKPCACGCGLMFEPKREWQIYATKQCRRRGNLKQRPVKEEAIKRTRELIEAALSALKELER